jgi:hypothetical protein
LVNTFAHFGIRISLNHITVERATNIYGYDMKKKKRSEDGLNF